jgi:anti-sigma regulatory factor (Ser/Thr protein kinase)
MSDVFATFGPELASVGAARRFVRRTLEAWRADGVDFEAAQVVSELTTNSVIHARSPFRVELSLDGDHLTIGVTDSSPVLPRLKRHSAQATTGRGIGVVAALALAWGTEPRADGKRVWATLSTGPRPALGLEADQVRA